MKIIVALFIILALLPTVAALEKGFCQGCVKNDVCYTKGTQLAVDRIIEHCAEDGIFLPVKNIGQGCRIDAECESFFCQGVCTTPKNIEDFNKSIFFIPLVIILLLGMGVMFSRHLKRSHRPKNEEYTQRRQKIPAQKKVRIDYTKRNTGVEEKIKQSLGELQDVLKKRR